MTRYREFEKSDEEHIMKTVRIWVDKFNEDWKEDDDCIHVGYLSWSGSSIEECRLVKIMVILAGSGIDLSWDVKRIERPERDTPRTMIHAHMSKILSHKD